ncbi:DNA mismatch repair protein MutS [Galdieria sulphuraria]|nr:DNA mismatch repair protein MutS [Galdieria sulphuraria]
MLRHYWDTKSEHPDYLLLYRVGDFYESFFDDAQILAETLEVTLTSKGGGKDLGCKVPMSGIPQHSLDKYLSILLKKNVKVAVCDQTEPATMAQAGSLVKRQVTRLLTPGTLTEDSMLDAKKNNYLAAIAVDMSSSTKEFNRVNWAIAYVDTSTGEFQGLEGKNIDAFIRELIRISPSEVLMEDNPIWKNILQEQCITYQLPELCYTARPVHSFDSQLGKQQLLQRFHCNSIEVFGLKDSCLLLKACAAIFHYLQETIERIAPINLNFFRLHRADEFVHLDENTLRNLEVLETLREGNKKGSLLWSVDRTVTCMGARLLRRWLLHPLRDGRILNARYEVIELLIQNCDILSGSLRANEKDFYHLGESLKKIPRLLHILNRLISSSIDRQKRVVDLLAAILSPLSEELIQVIVEEIDANITLSSPVSTSPHVVDNFTGSNSESVLFVQSRKNQQLEELEKEYKLHMQWMLEYERNERKRLGLHNLKVGYHKSLGYYISISKRALSKVPNDYIRKQTLIGEERYTTTQLLERERSILYVRECLASKEREIFDNFRNHLQQYAPSLQRIAEAVATLDVFCGLARMAMEREYCRPQLYLLDDEEKNSSSSAVVLKIENGRHPVVEQMISPGSFVSNSIDLSHQSSRLVILTGPNSSGKSCYLRQIGTIQLLAQIGSFVPAQEAQLSIMDAIFTRVGAVDDIGSGQSTFMVEMTETARILRQATKYSLVLLDEIGRGTTTLDGLSIAWSVAEYLSSNIQCLSIFATHYHEMNELASVFPWVINLQVKVIEKDDQVIFLHKVIPGGANKSYGIQVAGLSGLPDVVVERARTVWRTLEQQWK